MPGHAEVLTAARNLMERTDQATAGLWPRATALLARHALEGALDDFWRVRAPGMEHCSARAQLLCLTHYLGDWRSGSLTHGPGSAARAISIRTSCLRLAPNYSDACTSSSNW